MPADVIEVDFEARRLASTPFEERLDEVSEELETLRRGFDRYAWIERQWTLERRRVGSLQRALACERARNFQFTDEDVLVALRGCFMGVPVSATTIAAALYGSDPTQSARVRTGLALSRLQIRGCVRPTASRARGGAKRWIPMEGDDA